MIVLGGAPGRTCRRIRHVPIPEVPLANRVGIGAAGVVRVPGDSGQREVRPLRGPIYWNWAKPADAAGTNPASMNSQNYRPYGYVWADPMYRLYQKAPVLSAMPKMNGVI